jgi:hypothetical protein
VNALSFDCRVFVAHDCGMESPTIQEVVASVEHFCARHVVSLDELGRRKFGDRHRFEAFVDEECRNLVMMVTCEAMATVEGSRTEAGSETVEWPDGWWQEFRERWLPRWWLRRWPVRMDSREVVTRVEHKHLRLCPHVDIPRGDRVHFAWVSGANERQRPDLNGKDSNAI